MLSDARSRKNKICEKGHKLSGCNLLGVFLLCLNSPSTYKQIRFDRSWSPHFNSVVTQRREGRTETQQERTQLKNIKTTPTFHTNRTVCREPYLTEQRGGKTSLATQEEPRNCRGWRRKRRGLIVSQTLETVLEKQEAIFSARGVRRSRRVTELGVGLVALWLADPREFDLRCVIDDDVVAGAHVERAETVDEELWKNTERVIFNKPR